jgi:hypothetical protein
MTSPYGGDRGGGRKNPRKRGAQPGNVNRRSADLLPKQNADDRKRFLDALAEAQDMEASEQALHLRNLAFARVISLMDKVGVQRVLKALLVIDNNRKTEHKLAGHDLARRREAQKDIAIGEIWKEVEECERCGERVDRLLTGLELALLQIGGGDADWMDRARDESEEK